MSVLRIPDVGEDDDPIAAAIRYARAGWYVLPVQRATKHAGSVLGKGWPAKSSREQEDIISWFAGADHCLALHMGRSGAIAFDVDHPDRLPPELAGAVHAAGVPHQSTRLDVPGRGHYLFAVPPGSSFGNGAGKLGRTWGEVRGRNGIIVVAPSMHEKHEQGGRYAWVHAGQLPVLPTAIADLLGSQSDGGAAAVDAATDREVKAFLSHFTRADRPELLAGIVRQFQAAVSSGEARHNAAVRCTVDAMREAIAGFYPATTAAQHLATVFTAVMARARDGAERVRGEQASRAEFLGILAWAIAQAAAADPLEVRAAKEERLPQQDAPDDFSALLVEEQTGAAAGTAPEPDPRHEGAAPDSGSPDDISALRPSIGIDNEPDAITGIAAAVQAGALPDTYVRTGELVRVGQVSGNVASACAGCPTTQIIPVSADALRHLLAHHTDTYRTKATRSGATLQPASPAVATCKAVLTETRWPGLPELVGITASPVLRPDGSLLQTPGYDPSTRLYYTPDLDLPAVPEHPDVLAVAAARAFLLEEVLGDFPWASVADRANYVALLMTQILRPCLGGLVPLGAVSATERGSGKTLLTDIIGRLFGQAVRSWVADEDELRKAITATLIGPAPVVVFDNVGEDDKVDAPVLAKLLTGRSWDDRLLGRSEQVQLVNDRLWLVTGNNISFGGDIAQRSVLVRLDPRVPRPDLRTGFRIPDLEEWLEEEANRAALLHALLVMARAWISAGAPTEEFVMRGFRRWVRGMGGFLAFHGVPGFLANAEELADSDEDAAMWTAFLAEWHRRFGEAEMSATDLVQTVPAGGRPGDDGWGGVFVTREGAPPNSKSLGRMLAARRGRFFGDLALRGERDLKNKVWRWRVQRSESWRAGA